MARQSKTKAFRRTDITTVEDNLQEAALQKAVTGGIIADAASADLFVVDRQGEMAKAGWSRQQKTLRLDEIVRPKSKIEVPSIKKASKVSDALVKRKLQAALKKAPAIGTVKKTASTGMKDIWADDVPVPKTKISRDRETRARAVPLPAPGTSYNPDEESHAALMEAAAAQEIARLERIEKTKAAVEVPRAPRPDVLNYDESTGMIFEDIFGSAPSDEEPAGEATELAQIPIVKRKSKAEKRREAEQATADQAKLADRQIKMVESQALHAKTLFKTVKAERRAEMQRRAELKKLKAARQVSLAGRKLGPMRFVEPMMAVQLPEEQSGALRTLRPEGNLVEERFKALQAQAKIEPRVRRALGRRRYDLKSYEKHSYKSFA